MITYVIVYWNNGNIQNVIYTNMSKTEAFEHFEDEYGIEHFPIINILEL